MQRALALARSGVLSRLAGAAAAEHSSRRARAEQLVALGCEVGLRRARQFRNLRSDCAVALGYASLEGYYLHRYVRDGARIEDLQRELGASYAAIRADLRGAGVKIRPRRAARTR